jgi:hypothetical protein
LVNRLIDELTAISKNIFIGVALTLLFFFLLNTFTGNAEGISAFIINFEK